MLEEFNAAGRANAGGFTGLAQLTCLQINAKDDDRIRLLVFRQ
jgi:hypothetical protein